MEYPYETQKIDQPLIDVDQPRDFQEKNEEHILDQFLSSDYQENLDYYTNSTPFSGYEHVFHRQFQETYGLENYFKPSICTIDKSIEHSIIPIKISLGKLLYINSKLDLIQQQKLTKVLQKQSGAFAWEYEDM